MLQYDVIKKTIPSAFVVSRRITIPTNDEASEYLGTAFREVWNHVSPYKDIVAGPQFTIWHQSANTFTNEVVEAILPIKQVIPGSDRIQVYELKETLVASAIHNGNFWDFTQLHPAILQWVEENAYEVEGSYREIYIEHDPNNYSKSTTEVQYPLKPISEK
jgi:effector-binding domain-containing protein